MKKLLTFTVSLIVTVALLLSAGCAGRNVATEPVPVPPPMPAPMAPSMSERGYMDEDVAESGGKSYSAQGTAQGIETAGGDIERRIVRTGYMTLEVKDIADAIKDISMLASQINGYVVSSTKQGGDKTISGRISIRVPVQRFDEALDKLRKMAIEVPYESTEGRDVTEEYSDLKAQLRNLEATEAQYLELLKKADKVEDILKVQRELTNVRGQIERTKGRIQYLERTSDMALIEVALQQPRPLGETGWSALKTLQSAARGLLTFGKFLVDMLIWIAIFSPIWVPIVVLVWYFRRKYKAKAAK